MLIVSLLTFFGVLIFLAFFSYPQTDDYNIMKDLKTFGFFGYDRFIYEHWGGRFFSLFLGKIQAYNNGLLENYWIHTIYLLVANAISCFVLLNTLNDGLLRFTSDKSVVLLSSLVYLVLQISALPEISTAYYWFSSAVSYQPAIILIQFELALLIRFSRQTAGRKMSMTITGLIFLVILINFTNEVSVLINGVILTITFLLMKNRKGLIIIAIIVYLVTAFITASAPGNRLRSENIPSAGILNASIFAAGRTLIACWTALKNPLVIISIFTAFLAGQRGRSQIVLPVILKKFLDSPVIVCLFPLLSMFFVLVPVMYVSNGSLPERANNELVQMLIIVMLALACLSGMHYGRQFNHKFPRHLNGVVFSLAIICNSSFGILVKDAISAPVYEKVMKQRVAAVKQAVFLHNDAVTFPTYTSHADSIVSAQYPSGRSVIKSVLIQTPTVLYTPAGEDELSSLVKMGSFYGLGKVRLEE